MDNSIYYRIWSDLTNEYITRPMWNKDWAIKMANDFRTAFNGTYLVAQFIMTMPDVPEIFIYAATPEA